MMVLLAKLNVLVCVCVMFVMTVYVVEMSVEVAGVAHVMYATKRCS